MIEYDRNAITYEYVTNYIRSELPKKQGLLGEMEKYAEENSVPIVPPETAALLSVLSNSVKPMNILEIGCAIGYSAITLSEGLGIGGQITTLEYNSDMVKIARANIEKAGLSDTITVVETDAKDYIKDLNGVYDMIFLDGPKAHYIYMLDDCVRLLRKGGLLVADNVLYKGMTTTDDLVIRRKITIVRRLRQFITELNSRTDLKTSILPLGDGMTISVKL
mgnify:CR=1 FL=1